MAKKKDKKIKKESKQSEIVDKITIRDFLNSRINKARVPTSGNKANINKSGNNL